MSSRHWPPHRSPLPRMGPQPKHQTNIQHRSPQLRNLLRPRGHPSLSAVTFGQCLVSLDFQSAERWLCQDCHRQALSHRPALLLPRPRHSRPVSLRGPTPIAHPAGRQDLPCCARSRAPGTTAHHRRPPPPSIKARCPHPRGSHPQGGLLHGLRGLPPHREVHLVGRRLES